MRNYPDAIEFLYSLSWFGARPGLDTTRKLAVLAGNPQDRLRFVHVAGTNGKGSTCAFLESLYRQAGLRVGLFTSPHLVAFGERIQINRRLMPEEAIVRLAGQMQTLIEKEWGAAQADHPTFFEAVTVMALLYFAEQNCDLVIWETGLGGRLDATNIVTPLASVITNIQYDHQKWLGETLSSIAAEKAGIIKPGVPVITAAEAPDALAVISQTAARLQAPLTLVTALDTRQPPLGTLELPLLGEHQRMNAAVALAAVRALASKIPVVEPGLTEGLLNVRWPGRLQIISQPSGRRILLDGAHNAGGAEILVQALGEYFPSQKPALVLGILRDKDCAKMCEILAPRAGRIVLTRVPSERSAEPHDLAEACRRANPGAEIIERPTLRAALEETARDVFVTIAGSLYLIGEAMELLGLSPSGSAGNERGLNEWSQPDSQALAIARGRPAHSDP